MIKERSEEMIQVTEAKEQTEYGFAQDQIFAADRGRRRADVFHVTTKHMNGEEQKGQIA